MTGFCPSGHAARAQNRSAGKAGWTERLGATPARVTAAPNLVADKIYLRKL